MRTGVRFSFQLDISVRQMINAMLARNQQLARPIAALLLEGSGVDGAGQLVLGLYSRSELPVDAPLMVGTTRDGQEMLILQPQILSKVENARIVVSDGRLAIERDEAQ